MAAQRSGDGARILVQIASYRDPECAATVDDLFRRARHPERLTVAICWQHREGDAPPFHRDRPYAPRVKVIEVHASAARGVCWARRLTQLLWDGETHTLVIDSHMRMVEHWDELCLAQLDDCPTPRALLSGTPASYTPPDRLEPNPRPTILRADFFNPAGEMRCKGVVLRTAPPAPLRGAFLAAGFMFSRAEVIEEVPYDPHSYFNQEEVSYAIRLWSHGWDVYHPSRVIAYHHYLRPGDGVPARPLHWGDCPEWSTYQAIGRARFNLLTGHDPSAPREARVAFDRHGLGAQRSLAAFQDFCGVDFRAKTVTRHALTCGFIADLRRWLPQEIHVPELAAPEEHPERLAQLRERPAALSP